MRGIGYIICRGIELINYKIIRIKDFAVLQCFPLKFTNLNSSTVSNQR